MSLHKLCFFETCPYPGGLFVCNICRESGCGPVYHCADCDFDVHVMCAATAKQQTHFTHPQHLLRLVRCTTLHHTCDSCGTLIHTSSFRCDMCDFDIHPTCVRAPRYMKHPTHRHALTLSTTSSDSLRCDGCRRPVRKLFYKCNRPLSAGSGCCNYVLHQACASLPSQVAHPKHRQHLLKRLDLPSHDDRAFSCAGCGKQSKGWRFHCSTCNFSLDPACATSVHEFAQAPEVITQDRSIAPSSSTTSVRCEVSHASVLQAVSQAPMPSDSDWEAFEKVLCFARELVRGRSSDDVISNTAQSRVKEENNGDACPTCLEEYDLHNPKKLMSCGHHFHLACILNWMERSPFCPICRKCVTIPV